MRDRENKILQFLHCGSQEMNIQILYFSGTPLYTCLNSINMYLWCTYYNAINMNAWYTCFNTIKKYLWCTYLNAINVYVWCTYYNAINMYAWYTCLNSINMYLRCMYLNAINQEQDLWYDRFKMKYLKLDRSRLANHFASTFANLSETGSRLGHFQRPYQDHRPLNVNLNYVQVMPF